MPQKLFIPNGYVCRLPHFGHGIGMRNTDAFHSIAVEINILPQLLHLNFAVSKTIKSN